MSHDNNVKYGNVTIPDEAFEPKNYKVRVTTFIDGDILSELRRIAKLNRSDYKTLLNALLRLALELDEAGK